MGFFTKLWAALGGLTSEINAATADVAEARRQFRARLGLDDAPALPPPVAVQQITDAEPAANGHARRIKAKA